MIKTVLVYFFFAVLVYGKPLTIRLPMETAKLKSSKLPGFQLAQQKCLVCHSADIINQQPPALTLQQWTAEVTKMRHAYGAPLKADEVVTISQYLAATYGSGKP